MDRQTVSLNGQWTVVFDDQNTGKEQRYYEKFPSGGKAINVPGVWEEIRPGYDGVGWYKTKFEAPAGFESKTVRLHFGAVNYYSEVYLNGERIGDHESGYTPFEFDISKLLKSGTNDLVVRVINPPKRRYIEGFRTGAPLSQSDIPTWKAGWYYNFGGIWQDVSLIITPRVYIDDIFVEPLPKKQTARVHVTVVSAAAGQAELTVDIAAAKGSKKTGGDARATMKLKKGATVKTFNIKISDMQLWDTENPFLYNCLCKLHSKSGVDELGTRFGMRTFTAKGTHFYLNDKRIVLKGVLQQGVYPKHIVFAPDKQMLRDELNMIKQNGMNFFRLHLKPDPQTLDMMDEMGILACEEPPLAWIQNSPQITRRCLTEVDGLIKRDRNHPSIIMWCLLNETYHYRSFTWQAMDKLRKTISNRARDLDPTRIVGDNSGGGAKHGQSAGAMMPYERKYTPMRDLHQYCSVPIKEEEMESRYRKLPREGGPVYISEFAALECPPDYEKTLARYSAADKKIGLEDYAQYQSYYDSLKQRFEQANLKPIFGSVAKLIEQADQRVCEDIRTIVGSIRTSPHLGGYAICQIADASGEIFGVTDIWRQPKKHFQDFAAGAATPLLVPHFKRRVVEPGERLNFELYCVNEEKVGAKYTAQVVLKNLETGRKVDGVNQDFVATGWVQTVLKTRFDAPKKPGRYIAEVTLKETGKVRNRNSLRFTVVEVPALEKPQVHVPALDDELKAALKTVGIQPIPSSNNTATKELPFLFMARGIESQGVRIEVLQQISRQVRLGGVAIMLEPAAPVFYDSLLPWPIRLMVPMRSMAYARPHPILEGVPDKGFLEYEYSHLLPGVRTNPEDVKAAGGTTIVGGIGAHMWTQPDEYQWSSMIDEIPVERGKIIMVQMPLVKRAAADPVARRILRNLVEYAHSQIKPGLDDRSVGRCMDPIDEPA